MCYSAIHDFEAQQTDDLFFSVKPYKTESLNSVPLLVRTYWKYTSWRKISFSILAEDRHDVEAGYYQIDSGALGNCEPGKNIQVLMPFRNIQYRENFQHNLFLHGFEISTQYYSEQSQSPFEIQIVASSTNSSGIVVFFSVTTITQVQSLYISYVAWAETTLTIVSGKFVSEITSAAEISHIPESNIGRNYARIFGITGFIINHERQNLFFQTHWSGSKFVFNLEISQSLIKYISFEYLFFLGSECSDCPNYPFIFNGTCRQFCPEGFHATS